MIKSMTGFGRGTTSRAGGKINVEIKSLNSRYFDIKFLGIKINPRTEEKSKRHISNFLNRGNIIVHIDIDEINSGQVLTFNKDRFDKIQSTLNEIHIEYGQKLNLSEIINTHDILSFVDVDIEDDEILQVAIDAAIKQLNNMRSNEGKQIYKDLMSRIRVIKKELQSIKRLSDKFPKKKKKELSERIRFVIDQDRIDQNRLMQEIAYLIERSDITEEIVRSGIHLDNFIKYLKYDEPVGKRLNFLIQEINREVNTVGSKSPIHDVTSKVVEIKNEIEKIREQVQNIL
jgi:uncharacterized protein (TIGR00255 family)|tara:strand:- start:543 stop:1403 length:861 start_codon:yes stop_codon:yes gene_type:complete